MTISNEDLRILIVAEHASMQFGGEASLPLYYFKLFRARGIETWMLVHARTREELRQSLGDDFPRVSFVEDTLVHKILWKLGRFIPRKIDEQTLGLLRHLWTQMLQRRVGREMVRQHRISIVHEPMPISPKEPSIMHSLGAALVVGPLCGGMDYPPAFQSMQSGTARAVEHFGRMMSHILHRLARGKISADAVVVANEVTREALPHGVKGRVYEVVESGVDLAIWKPGAAPPREPREPRENGKVRFVFAGRLVDWKGVDLLLEAFGLVARRTENALLEIIGDGPLRQQLEARAKELGVTDRARFAGWLSRPQSAQRVAAADVFVLPSMRECGGTVILEAFALGVPVIATNWGGPSNYVDDATGIRVNPDSREGFINALAKAMLRLAGSSELRRGMSAAAIQRASMNYYDWDSKADRMIEIFRETLGRKRET